MKCINCNQEINGNEKYCGNCGIDFNNIEIIEEIIPRKKHRVLLVIVSIILLALIGTGTWFVAVNIMKNNNNKENIIEVEYNKNKEILFNNYILTIPSDYSIKSNPNKYLEGKENIILYNNYPLNHEEIVNNKELLIKELENQGYEIDANSIKIEEKYLTINGKSNNVKNLFIFYELDKESNIFLIVTSKYLGEINNNWMKDVLDFLESAKKIN